jgi:hypothetical protein
MSRADWVENVVNGKDIPHLRTMRKSVDSGLLGLHIVQGDCGYALKASLLKF